MADDITVAQLQIPSVLKGLGSSMQQGGQKIADTKNTDAVADSLQKDLGLEFKRDYERGTSTAQLDPQSAKNLRTVLAAMSPQEKEEAFGKLNYAVNGNNELVVSGTANMGMIDSGKLTFSIMSNKQRVPVLQEAMKNGNADTVHHMIDPNYVAGAPGTQPAPAQAQAGASEKAGVLNAKLSPALQFSEDANGQLSAPITPQQQENLTKVFRELNKNHEISGSLKFSIDPNEGHPKLVITNSASLKTEELSNFNADKNGNADALLTALQGNINDTKSILTPPAKKQEMIPLSSADQPLDTAKLAAAGFKIPDTQASPSAHASGVEANQKAAERGIA